MYPHLIISELNVGDTVKKGDVVSYNKGFFELDPFNKRTAILKNSLTAKVAFWESKQTHEDSSSVSEALSDRLVTNTIKLRNFTVDFKQNIRNIVKVGQEVKAGDPLLTIEDLITSDTDIFDEESLATLSKLQKQSPKAQYQGVIDRIEVYYHGEKRDMSHSLKAITDKSDKLIAEERIAQGKSTLNGRVNDDYRVSGVPLAVDKAEIKVYIKVRSGVGIGDKLIFSNQMKSVVGEVMNYKMLTQDNETIDAVFGFRSILARIVSSPMIIGTTTTLMKIITNKAVQLYKSITPS